MTAPQDKPRTSWFTFAAVALAVAACILGVVNRYTSKVSQGTHIGSPTPFPPPGDAGTFLGSNGPAVTPGWKVPASSGLAASTLWISPVDITAGVGLAEGEIGSTWVVSLGSQGSGANTPVGIGFTPTKAGLNSIGGRIYWIPYSQIDSGACVNLNVDAGIGSDVVKLELWQGTWNGSTWSTSVLASSTVTVTYPGVWSAAWGAVPLTAGYSYALTAFDQTAGTLKVSGEPCYTQTYTQISATNTGAFGALASGNGNPTSIGAQVNGYGFAVSTSGQWYGLYCNSGGDCAPQNVLSHVMFPVEPLFQ